MTSTQNSSSPRIGDYISLAFLKLAKMKRTPFNSTQKDDYDTFYEGFFEEKDVEAYNKDARMAVRRETLNSFFEQNIPAGSTVLDVGCGLGDVLDDLHNRFKYQLSGIDYAESNVSFAKKRLAGKAEIQQANIYNLPFKEASVDVAICLEVLEHIEDDNRAFKEISRVLRPGGCLIVAVPYTFYWPSYQRLLGHFRHYTRTSLVAKALASGFTGVRQSLPNYHNWHQTYTKRYALIRLQHVLFGKLVASKSVYDFKYPWQKKPALEMMLQKLESLRIRDSRINYNEDDQCTFLVITK